MIQLLHIESRLDHSGVWVCMIRFLLRPMNILCLALVNILSHSAPLVFSTQTKSSEDKTSFGTFYDVKEVRISQEKHLSSGFPLSYQLNSAGRAALVGRLAGTG